jgi:TatD DNase family protein
VFDSHCHVTDIDQPDDVLASAVAAGVRSLLTVGYDPASNAAVLGLRQRVPRLPIALGLHPWYAAEAVEPVLRLIQDEHPVAVGEAGLDLWKDPDLPPLERQVAVLEAELELAVRLGLPVTLHSRKALGELWAVVKNFPGLRGALHAFGGSIEQARQFVECGFLVGVGGGVTRGRAERVRRVAAWLPVEALLVETDAPAIGMDIVEPPAVRPAHLRRVVEVVAELRGQSFDEIEAITDANAVRLFGPRAAGDLGVVPRYPASR